MAEVADGIVDLRAINAKLLYQGVIIESGFAVRDGRILKLGKEPELPPAEHTIDARGLLIIPGAIDVHAHLRDQELSYKETFETGTAAAISGGVTTVLDMPNNSPPTNTFENFRERIELAKEQILCNVGFHAAPNRSKDETRLLLDAGSLGLKVNMLRPIGEHLDESTLEENLRESAKRGRAAIFHAEDGERIRALQQQNEIAGRIGYEDFLSAHTPDTESSAAKTALRLAEKTGCQGHIAHISCGATLRLISAARKPGVDISCEVTPHHLLLGEEKLTELDGLAIMTPPIRRAADRAELWEGLRNGEVEICATDHAPHTWEEKTAQNVWDVAPGVSGLDIFIPLMLTQVNKGRITLKRLIEATSEMPARIFRLRGRGTLLPGYYADFATVKTKVRRKVRGETFKSKAKFTPFEGSPLTAEVAATYVRGECMMNEGEVIGRPGSGMVIRGSGNAEVPS